MAVHLISSNVSDLGKSDVGYLQFPFVQKDLTPMNSTADPAVGATGRRLHVQRRRDREGGGVLRPARQRTARPSLRRRVATVLASRRPRHRHRASQPP